MAAIIQSLSLLTKRALAAPSAKAAAPLSTVASKLTPWELGKFAGFSTTTKAAPRAEAKPKTAPPRAPATKARPAQFRF